MYQKPELRIVLFTDEDVLNSASIPGGGEWGGEWGGDGNVDGGGWA